MVENKYDITQYIKKLNFTSRPIHISHKYRIIYNISRLILILGGASQKTGSSILKLQILSDALDNEEHFERIIWLLENNGSGFIRNWSYNPLLSRAVSYSNAEGLTGYSSTGKIVLTSLGNDFFKEIMNDENLLIYEKSQIGKIQKKLSDNKLLQIIDNRSI
ncbi:MAG: hypothetical protein N4A40_07005 [Tissierellales bacterium]|jgi:hypothetical protein|nr:hypothetical protein [Tissierellales bacterium]